MPRTEDIIKKLNDALEEFKTVEDISAEAKSDFCDQLEELIDDIEEELENPSDPDEEGEEDDAEDDDMFD